MLGRSAWLAVLAVAIACGGGWGCNARRVTRQEETARLEERLAEHVREARIDPAVPLSVERCEQIAMANSLGLRVRRLALQLQDEQVRLAMSDALPNARLNFEETRRSNDPAMDFGGQSFSFEDRTQQRLAVTAIAPVLDFGLAYYSYQIALDRRTQEQLLVARAEQLLRRDVRVAYVQHAGAIRQERLARQAYQAALQVMRVAGPLEREHITVEADTALVDASVKQAALNLSLATQRVEEMHLILSQLMSLPPGVRFQIDERLPALPPTPDAQLVNGFEQRALAVRPELAVSDLQRHISANAVRKEASAFFPTFNLVGAFNWSNNSMVLNPSYFLLGYQVTHSLLDSGKTIWRYREAKEGEAVEKERALLIGLGVLYEVDLQALRVRQAFETIIAAEALETSRRKALQRVINLYMNGMEDEAGAARALADLTMQATTLDQAQTAYLAAWHELEASALPETTVLMPATQPATGPSTQPADPWKQSLETFFGSEKQP